MSLEKQVKETQLEFPFLNELRMSLYATKQLKDMKDLWNLAYRYDGDHGKELRFGDFVSEVWIKGGYAKRFHEHNYQKYFYDSLHR